MAFVIAGGGGNTPVAFVKANRKVLFTHPLCRLAIPTSFNDTTLSSTTSPKQPSALKLSTSSITSSTSTSRFLSIPARFTSVSRTPSRSSSTLQTLLVSSSCSASPMGRSKSSKRRHSTGGIHGLPPPAMPNARALDRREIMRLFSRTSSDKFVFHDVQYATHFQGSLSPAGEGNA